MAGNRRPLRFRQSELERALRASKASGVPVNVNIGKDGSLNVVSMPVSEKLRPSEADDIIAKLK
ncbi:MAG: hypothetical protein ABSD11_12350 [Methylocella sp.]|jgi:hypothetical protein